MGRALPHARIAALRSPSFRPGERKGALGSPGAPRDASAHAPEASESAKPFSRAEASLSDATAHAPGASESAKLFSRAEASLRDASAHAPEASESA